VASAIPFDTEPSQSERARAAAADRILTTSPACLRLGTVRARRRIGKVEGFTNPRGILELARKSDRKNKAKDTHRRIEYCSIYTITNL